MKKGNWLAYIIALAISAFLLVLWYWIGLDHVDYPFDLILSIIWWIGIALFMLVVHRSEQRRRERARTCYIMKGGIFNSEAGMCQVQDAADAEVDATVIEQVLASLEYGFGIEELPYVSPADRLCVVRSAVFDARSTKDADGNERVEVQKWEGEVALPARKDDAPIPFATRAELVRVLHDVL